DRDAVDRQLVAVEDADVSRGKARRPCLRVEGPHGLVARHLQRGGHRLRRGGEGSPEEADHERRSSFCRRRTAMAFMVIISASRTMIAADVRASKKLRFSLPCQR